MLTKEGSEVAHDTRLGGGEEDLLGMTLSQRKVSEVWQAVGAASSAAGVVCLAKDDNVQTETRMGAGTTADLGLGCWGRPWR